MAEAGLCPTGVRWIDVEGRPVDVSAMTANACLLALAPRIQSGALLGDILRVVLRDPISFRAGLLHEHAAY